jgi:hypothetical protein
MALLFMDSCGDHYISNAADTPPKYNSGVQVATTTAGRHGYGYSGVRSTLTKYLVGAATARPISSPICIWGCALKWWGGTAVDSPLRIVDTPGPVLHLKGTTGGGFQVLRAVPSEGTVVIAESDPAYYAMNRWFYLEWESLLAEVAGYTKVWVNGELIIDESGLETYTTEYQELHDLLPSTTRSRARTDGSASRSRVLPPSTLMTSTSWTAPMMMPAWRPAIRGTSTRLWATWRSPAGSQTGKGSRPTSRRRPAITGRWSMKPIRTRTPR